MAAVSSIPGGANLGLLRFLLEIFGLEDSRSDTAFDSLAQGCAIYHESFPSEQATPVVLAIEKGLATITTTAKRPDRRN